MPLNYDCFEVITINPINFIILLSSSTLRSFKVIEKNELEYLQRYCGDKYDLNGY